MKILVTGGAGFIGSNLVNRLLMEYDCTIIVVDNLVNGDFSRLIKSNNLILINDSVLNLEAYSSYLNEVDYIFHLACVQISKSNTIPLTDLETNAISTLNMLEYLRSHKNTNLKKFIYTSSCSVYGNSLITPITEKVTVNISSIYAATKYLGENYTNLYYKNYDIPITIVRYSNVYGYHQTPKDKVCGVIGKFIYNAINNLPLTIYGDGTHTRDYTFIEDAIEATLLAAFSKRSLGRIYNISSNSNYSVNDLIQIIKSVYPNTYVNYETPRIIDNIIDRLISYDTIQLELNWKPKCTLTEGIYKTINWFNTKN
jgi:UDP-glucose 4-epimerase